MGSNLHRRAWRGLLLVLAVVFSIHAPAMAYMAKPQAQAALQDVRAPAAKAKDASEPALIARPEGRGAGAGHCHESMEHGIAADGAATPQDGATPFADCCDGNCPMILCHLTFTSTTAPWAPSAWSSHFHSLFLASFYLSQHRTPLIRPPIPA